MCRSRSSGPRWLPTPPVPLSTMASKVCGVNLKIFAGIWIWIDRQKMRLLICLTRCCSTILLRWVRRNVPRTYGTLIHTCVCGTLDMHVSVRVYAVCILFSHSSIASLLQGEILHWFCCALFAACRQSTTPTVGGQDAVVMGNCVPLNNLLRSCQMRWVSWVYYCLVPITNALCNIFTPIFSIYEFKKKIKLWCDMANLSQSFIQQIAELERKFSITFTLYKKYRVIIEQLFICPPNEKKHSKFR